MYAFLFDKKSLTLVIVAATLAASLTFAAGVLVGANFYGSSYYARSGQGVPDSSSDLPVLPKPTEQATLIASAGSGTSGSPVGLLPQSRSETRAPSRKTSEPIEGVAPDPPRVDSFRGASPEPEGFQRAVYSIQAGTFRVLENAQKRVAYLEPLGDKPYVKVFRNDQGELFYLVRVGRFSTSSEAESAAARIRDHLARSGNAASSDREQGEVLVIRTESSA